MVTVEVYRSFCGQKRKRRMELHRVRHFKERRAAGVPFYCSQPCAEAAGVKTTGKEPGVSREERASRIEAGVDR